MAGSIRKRRDIKSMPSVEENMTFGNMSMGSPASEMEVFGKEVMTSLINDNLPPTPNNFALYFDRLLENKSENLRKQINAIIELEDSNDAEKTIALEKNLKQGFSSITNLLQVSANLYKNMALMSKLLEKRKAELENSPDQQIALNVINNLQEDVNKLNSILRKQVEQMKSHYDQTATLVRSVENDTIFDNQYGVYNKRYLLGKLEQEISLVKEFKHHSSLIAIELSRSLVREINNDKAIVLMIRTIARLLMKTSRRSDIVTHYGSGIFVMILKHTDLPSAEKASARLCELVASSNFFLAEREINLKVSIGIKTIQEHESVEEQIVQTLDAMEKADSTPTGYFIHQEPESKPAAPGNNEETP